MTRVESSESHQFWPRAFQIDNTILVECKTELFQDSHGWNGTWNDRNRILDAQIKHLQKLTLNLGFVNPSFISSSTTTTSIDKTHHCHLLTTVMSSSLLLMAALHHICCPQPRQQE